MRGREVIEDMPDMPNPIKERFLQNLEKALRLMICDRLNTGADDATRRALASDVADFIRYNAGEYTLEELVETDLAIGLFYEYQDAKRLVDQAPASPEAPSTETGVRMGAGRWLETLTGMAFIWVPGGLYLMGSGDWDDQGLADEKPVYEVWLDVFWMAQTPVTVGQFRRLADAAPGDNFLDIFSEPEPGDDDVPVVRVSWHHAVAFARRLSERTGQIFRLPSEAQWEYAARSGGQAEKYAGSARADDVAWYADNSSGRLHRVARKKPNGLNLYDMCGNVAEWCLDHYAKSAYQHHDGHNPVIQLDSDTARVVRGGSWRYGAKDVRCADRGLLIEDRRETDVGFRLIRFA